MRPFLVLISALCCLAGALPAADLSVPLTYSGLAKGDFHGGAVAIDGDWAVVGAPGKGTAGAAHVFRKSGGSWTQQATLRPAELTADALFGANVVIHGRHIAVAASEDARENVKAGGVWLYTRQADESWAEQRLSIPGLDQWTKAGWSMAMSADTLVLGITNQSRALVYPIGPDGTIGLPQTLRIEESGVYYGISVAVDGDLLAVGASRTTEGSNLSRSGRVYCYRRDAAGVWQTNGVLKNDNPEKKEEFGSSLAMDGDTLAVGKVNWSLSSTGYKKGAVLVFQHNGTSWNKRAEFSGSNTAKTDLFGWSLALSGDNLVVGAPHDDDKASEAGQVFHFRRSGKNWNQVSRFGASGLDQNDRFGLAVALSGGRVVVGAPGGTNENQLINIDSKEKGAAFIGDLTDTTAPHLTGIIADIPDGAYSPGVEVPLSLIFNEAVSLSGGPLLLTLDTGATLSIAPGAPAQRVLEAVYTSAGHERTADLDLTSIALGSGASLADTAGNAAQLSIPTAISLANKRSIVITDAPRVTAVGTGLADGTYKRGAEVTITVAYTEAVSVTGTPRLALATIPPRSAVYRSGSGSNTLQFSYVVAYGDRALDLEVAGLDALTDGQISAGGTAASRLLPVGPAAANALSTQHDLVIDGIASERLSGDALGTGAALGTVVAIDGDWAVAGAPDAAGGGAAVIYRRQGNAWLATQTLQPNELDVDAEFGVTVAIDGDTLIIGAPEQPTGNADTDGAAYVYVRNGNNWAQQTRLNPPAESEGNFAHVVAIEADLAVVNSIESGQRPDHEVWQFTRSAGNWDTGSKVSYLDNSLAYLTPDDPSQWWRPRGAQAKNIVLTDGNLFTTSNTNSAVYCLQQQADGSWVADYESITRTRGIDYYDEGITGVGVQPSDATSMGYGSSLALVGDTAWVGMPLPHSFSDDDFGSVFRLSRLSEQVADPVGQQWITAERLFAPEADQIGELGFGSSLAANTSRSVVGAPGYYNPEGYRTGGFYFYEESTANWQLSSTVSPPALSEGDDFAASMALSGDWLVVGAPGTDTEAADCGAVYFFSLSGAVERPDPEPRTRSISLQVTAEATVITTLTASQRGVVQFEGTAGTHEIDGVLDTQGGETLDQGLDPTQDTELHIGPQGSNG